MNLILAKDALELSKANVGNKYLELLGRISERIISSSKAGFFSLQSNVSSKIMDGYGCRYVSKRLTDFGYHVSVDLVSGGDYVFHISWECAR